MLDSAEAEDPRNVVTMAREQATRLILNGGDQTLGSNRFCHRLLAIQLRVMGTDLTAILISSVFLGVGSVVAKFFPEASLMAGVFLVGLALVNITLYFVS